MSDSEAALRKWRDQGSLRYLACELGVTPKQVTRYWDNGWIDCSYRTPKGHRRIRYADSTVEKVALMVRWAKEMNVRTRYHLTQIDYCGTIIPVKGCNSVHDLYRRARKAGLSERAARNVAYTPDIHAPPSEQIAWDSLLALNDTYGEEVLETMRVFSPFPLHFLLQASDSEDFRARAKRAWQKIRSFYELREELRPLSSNDQKARDIFQKLLSQPDLFSFTSTGATHLNCSIALGGPMRRPTRGPRSKPKKIRARSGWQLPRSHLGVNSRLPPLERWQRSLG